MQRLDVHIFPNPRFHCVHIYDIHVHIDESSNGQYANITNQTRIRSQSEAMQSPLLVNG